MPSMKEQYSLDDSDEQICLRGSWQQVLKRLSAELRPAWFERFIRPLEPVNLENGLVTLAAPGPSCKSGCVNDIKAP